VRDDLHRGAPVPRRWRNVIRHCARDSDWQSEGPRAFASAVAADLNEQVSRETLNVMQDRVVCGAVPLPGTDAETWLGRHLTPMENHAARALMRDQQQGGDRESAIERALGVAAVQHVNAIARQISAHIQAKAAKSHPEFAARGRVVFDRSRVVRAAVQRAQGESLRVRQSKPALSVDFPIGAV
jgi:hypothetical protein